MLRSVQACEHKAWHLHTWDPAEGHDAACSRMCFTCKSWRHAGPCREWRGALDWWRVTQGLEKREDWVYLVLTFRQGSTVHERYRTYSLAYMCWDRLRKRLVRSYGKLDYVQTVERHKRGGCHLNVVVGNPGLALAVESNWRKWRREVLIPSAVACGFGPVAWVERCDKASGRLAGYITKLANELTGALGKDQVPDDAPPHFRRIRASRGLLPPAPDSDMTGELVKVPVPEYNWAKPTCCGIGSDAHTHEGED